MFEPALNSSGTLNRRQCSNLFASEIKALLEYPGLKRDIEIQSIDNYLSYQYIPSPQTIFKGVNRLPPAHWQRIDRNEVRQPQRYWSIPFLPKTSMSRLQTQEALRVAVEDAVRVRLISDVPLGAFLSGGIDSSIVVGLNRFEHCRRFNVPDEFRAGSNILYRF